MIYKTKIKDNTVLNIVAMFEKTDAYHINIDKNYILKKDTVINIDVFKIVICDVTSELARLEITKTDNSEYNSIYEIYNDNFTYIEYYDNSKSSFENNYTDKGYIKVRLQESNTLYLENLIPILNENIISNNLNFKDYHSYFDIKYEIERKKEKSNLDNEIITQIDLFEKYNIDLIKHCTDIQRVDETEAKLYFEFIQMISNEHNYSMDKYVWEMYMMYSVINKYSVLRKSEIIALSYMCWKILKRSRYYFKANTYTRNLYDYAKNNQIDYKLACKYIEEAAEYEARVCDRTLAKKYLKEASMIASTNNDYRLSSELMYKYYKINGVFPEDLKEKVDIEEIKKDYGEYADIVIGGINYKSLKVDPVEFNPNFIRNYRFVLSDMENQIDLEGDLHTPYQRWSIFKDLMYKRCKLKWRSPKEMNPRVMFD